MKIKITKKQNDFINSTADEVLFGGAAGGGKTYGQLVDAFLYALKYPGSKQILFRRTFPELEKSIIRDSFELFPKEVCKYKEKTHTWIFRNKSVLDFSYLDNEKDVFKYQSAEYDVIRFDELTHFSESMYVYMLSRIRGANKFPKSMKSTTNPGNIGHAWVKKRFINIGKPNEIHEIKNNEGVSTRLFIPSLITDNKFILEKDPDYLIRLANLPEKERRSLRYGDWDITDGAFFNEFKRDVHVIEPFVIPEHWLKYVSLDYGLDMFAALWFAVSPKGDVFLYKELNKSNLIASEAVEMLKKMTNENISFYFAPPDLWGRRNVSGKSVAEVFFNNKIILTKCDNDRVHGWLSVKELLRLYLKKDEIDGRVFETSKLKIFDNCIEIIKNIPDLMISSKNPNDCETQPHDITHNTDALRYFCVSHFKTPKDIPKQVFLNHETKERVII